ncbi:2960_t:CDS:2 [Ambispora gerdemannii]|uniref:2960_t:CDS:1 n=1 Tax=Ambispora gerdemannii TaxID=144530 RepID=A0A9N8WDB2_9GLOM|nr:2960_t:CDS:2 [Ambispora gerdemannii]
MVYNIQLVKCVGSSAEWTGIWYYLTLNNPNYLCRKLQTVGIIHAGKLNDDSSLHGKSVWIRMSCSAWTIIFGKDCSRKERLKITLHRRISTNRHGQINEMKTTINPQTFEAVNKPIDTIDKSLDNIVESNRIMRELQHHHNK